jgi:hypothetical protein
MKINEFLNESDNKQLDELLGTAAALGLVGKGIAKGVGALTRGSTTGRQTLQRVGPRVAPTQAGSTAKADRILQRIGINSNTWLGSRWRDLLAIQIQRKGMKAFNLAQARAYENGKIGANLISDLGLTGFGVATLAIDIGQYYLARQAIEEQYANDPGQLNQALNELNVSTVASVIAPRVVGSVMKMSSKVIGAIVGKVAGPQLGAATKYWGGIVAKAGEAGAMAFFRNTDAGKKWLADALSFVTMGIGAAETLINDFMELGKTIVNVGKDVAGTLGMGSGGDGMDLISIGKAAMNGKSGADAWSPSSLAGQPVDS